MRRPLSGALLGLILGLAVAVILQQWGVWPLDRVTVFLLPALVGLLGMTLTSIGREGSTGTMVVALVITLPLAVWGALGLFEAGENGQLNGGCAVNAASDIDATIVTDTSRASPFRIDPEGGLTWIATSPGVFDDYEWRIWTEIGGIKYPLESEENQNNDAGSQSNEGNVSNATEFAQSRGIPLDQIRGAIIVGGDAADTCDGFAFVSLEGDPFETLTGQIALAVAILALIALFLTMFMGRGGEAMAGGSTLVVESGPETPSDGTAVTGAGVASGLAAAEDQRDRGQVPVDEADGASEDSGFEVEDEG